MPQQPLPSHDTLVCKMLSMTSSWQQGNLWERTLDSLQNVFCPALKNNMINKENKLWLHVEAVHTLVFSVKSYNGVYTVVLCVIVLCLLETWSSKENNKLLVKVRWCSGHGGC